MINTARSRITSLNTQNRRSSFNNIQKKRHLSPVNSVRNFDISYLNNRVTPKWPDSKISSNFHLQNAFNTLLRQARDTELRMEELLSTYKTSHNENQAAQDSTDERCIRANTTPTDSINIGKLLHLPYIHINPLYRTKTYEL